MRGARINRRQIPLVLVAALVLFVVAYVLFLAKLAPSTGGNWRTTNFG